MTDKQAGALYNAIVMGCMFIAVAIAASLGRWLLAGVITLISGIMLLLPNWD